MSNLSIHLLTEKEDINYVIKKYNTTYEELLFLNHNLNKNSHLGRLIYINKDNSINNSNIKTKLLDIIKIQRFVIISHINDYDDKILLEKELFSKIDELNFSHLNIDSYVINSIIKKIHENTIKFIDEIINKSYININNLKKEIYDDITSISSLLNVNNIKIIIEKILLSSVKIINKKYYDSYNIISSIQKDF